LALHHKSPIIEFSHDHHSAGVLDVFAHRTRAIWQPHLITKGVQKMALKDLLAAQLLFLQMRVF
jgi:hypothetical protein